MEERMKSASEVLKQKSLYMRVVGNTGMLEGSMGDGIGSGGNRG